MIVYDTPAPDGTQRTRITEKEAIRQMKELAAKKGHRYSDDTDALDDFLVIHWAWREGWRE